MRRGPDGLLKSMIFDGDYRLTSIRVGRVEARKMRRWSSHSRQVRCDGWSVVESAWKRNEGMRRRETIGGCRKIMLCTKQ